MRQPGRVCLGCAFCLYLATGCGDSSSSQANVGAGASGEAGASGGRAGNGGGGRGPSGGSGGVAVGGSGGSSQGGSSQGGTVAASAQCQPLPAPPSDAIVVGPDDADSLPQIVRDAKAGATIVLEDGTYTMTGGDEASRRIQIVSPGITLRSASGIRDAVVIDGEYLTSEIITVNASDVTIASLSVRHAIAHPIHVMGGPTADISGVSLYDLHIVDGGEQFVKVNTSGAEPNTYVDDGRLECSLLELTDAGRPHVNPVNGGCYTGGIDGHQARGWVVRSNTFKDIYCTTGLSEHAIHFWTSSRDTLVEQNTIIDCARGIGFGLGDGGGQPPNRDYADNPYPGLGYVGHYDGLIRNNVISISEGSPWFDSGIELEQAHGTRVYHNTIIHPDTAFASISHRWPNTQVTLTNNIVSVIKGRDGSSADAESNLENAGEELFVDRAAHDLHLLESASAAIDQAVTIGDAGNDIDDEPHDRGAPDLGADECCVP